MTQRTMFDEWAERDLVPISRTTDPESSKRAAREVVKSGVVASQQKVFLDLVQANPGLTSKCLGVLSGLPDGRFAAGRRLADLRRKKLVTNINPETSEDTRTTGNDMQWWVV